MTAEQWLHITSRLLALEVFVSTLAKHSPDCGGLIAALEKNAELGEVTALYTALPDEVVAGGVRQLRALVALLKEPPTP